MEDLPASILAEIAAVMRMDLKSLLSRYGHLLPENTSRTAANLRAEIIYKLQENHYRLSLPAETKEALNDALEKRRERKNARYEEVAVWFYLASENRRKQAALSRFHAIRYCALASNMIYYYSY